jgi:hypothetical protein
MDGERALTGGGARRMLVAKLKGTLGGMNFFYSVSPVDDGY